MKYEMSASQFITESNNGNINYDEFYAKFFEKLKEADKKYNLLITQNTKKPAIIKGKITALPISVKDCICTNNIKTTAGSKILENYIPPFDATAIKKLKEQ